jgi:chitinase
MVSANMADKSIFVREMYKAFVDQSKKQFGVVFSQSQFVIGLPATNWAAGSGYVPPAAIVSGVQQLKTQGYNPRGLMDWSVNWDATYVKGHSRLTAARRHARFLLGPCLAGLQVLTCLMRS